MLDPVEINTRMKAVLDRTDENVEKFGFQSIGVFGTEGQPPFTYTVGLARKQFADIIVFGLSQEVAHQLIWNVIRKMPDLPPFAGAIRVDEVIQGFDCALIDIADRPIFDTHMIQASAYYERHGLSPVGALQLVWPDKQGKLPSLDEDCQPEVVLAQLGWDASPT